MTDKIADAEFGLEVGPGPGAGEYTVTVVRTAFAGKPHSMFRLDVDTLAELSRRLEHTLLASASTARGRELPELERPLREIGSKLFQALFAGPIDTAYRTNLSVATKRGEKLRVVLSITAPELAVMPWEALYDDELQTYVCLNNEVVRHIDAPFTPDPVAVRPPLRILGLVASPKGLQVLDVDAEKQYLEKALARPISAGQAQLEWETQASWGRVHERLLQEQWHVLHFIGHGDYDPERGEGRIALVRDDGRADWVAATKLAHLLSQAQPTPRVVVLNSCASGQGDSQELFSGTAATLVRGGISAVVAMQFTVSDSAAVAFPRGFYTALASGRRVDEAVRSGRIQILGIGDGILEWVTPILHVRGEAAELFRLVVPAPSAVARDPLADPQWLDAVGAFWAKRWDEAVEHFEGLQARYPDEERVETKLKEARRQRDIGVWSIKAAAAADEGDWDTVVSALENLTAIDPRHPDAASRLEHAREAQRCRSLVEEMTALHQGGRWEAVLAAAQELARLDPEHADPNGIVSDAQARIREAQLADRYAQALNHLDQENWGQAAELFAAVDQEQPGYRDATALRAAAQRQLQELDLADKYRRATEAQARGDWTTAATIFSEIIGTQPDYRDAAIRGQACQKQQRIADLQAELRSHASANNWPAVIEASQQIASLDPSAADPDGLASHARERLDARVQQDRWIAGWSAQADAAASVGDWDSAVTALEKLAALDPPHPHAGARLEQAEQARIAQRRRRALVDEMTALHKDGRWEAVLTAAQELARLDPEHPDPGGIVSDAQAKIREAQHQGPLMGLVGPDGARRFQIRLTRHTGALIMYQQRTYTFAGTLDECERAYRAAQNYNLLAGWWSLFSVVAMNWIALFSNMSSVQQLRRIAQQPPDRGSGGGVEADRPQESQGVGARPEADPHDLYRSGKPPGTNGKATAALVTSLAGLLLFGLPSIAGLILGIIAMRETKQTGQDGYGIALAGTIIGGLVVIMYIVFCVIGASSTGGVH